MRLARFALVFVAGCILVSPLSVVAQQEQERPAADRQTASGVRIEGQIQSARTDESLVDPQKFELFLDEMIELPAFPLPANWNEMTDEERAQWFSEFQQSAAGREFFQKQDELINNRRSYQTRPDDKGNFIFEGVVPGDYELRGQYEDKVNGAAHRFSVYGQVSVKTTKIDLDPLEILVQRILQTGEEAPDFEVDALTGGQKLRLSQFRGKYVLLQFWATWCGPCAESMPFVRNAQRDLTGPANLVILGITVDDDLAEARRFVQDHQMNWLHAAGGGWGGQLSSKYGIESIPSFWLIDPQGKIVYTDEQFYEAFVEAADVHRFLEQFFSQQEARARANSDSLRR